MAGHARLWRSIPNAISIARLGAAPVLVVAVFGGRVRLFQWLLLACLLSDILDGLIARVFRLTSKLGAALDSIADVVTALMVVLGVAVFQRTFVSAHRSALLLVVVLYAAEVVASLWRYGRVSSFHTLLSRVAAYAAGIFVMTLFFWGYHGWLFHLAVAVYVVELAEEMALIYLLPEWRSDVGGMLRVLNRRGAEL